LINPDQIGLVGNRVLKNHDKDSLGAKKGKKKAVGIEPRPAGTSEGSALTCKTTIKGTDVVVG